MEIQSKSYNTFKARWINKETILKFDSKTRDYLPQDVNFVEINPNNKYDIRALFEIANNWIYGMYSNVISYNAKRLNEKELDKSTNKIFALTIQKNNFKKLKTSEILGIIETDLEEPKKVNLNYIQVCPDNVHTKKNRLYKDIGSKMVKSIRLRYMNKALTLNPIDQETEFYKKLGLREVCKNPITYEIESLNCKKR